MINKTHPAAINKKKQSLRKGRLATFGLFTITAIAPETAIGSNTAAPNKAPNPNLVVSPP